MTYRFGPIAALTLLASVAHAADLPPVQSQGGPVKVESLAKFEMPWGMAYLPDGRLLITEKPGRLKVFADGKVSEPIEGVPAVAFGGQNGLLDVAVDPEFAKNSYVYLSYAEAAEVQPAGTKDSPEPRLGAGFKAPDPQIKGGAVARGKLEGNKLTGVTVIWRQEPKTIGRGHFGHRIVFGRDGTMFITSGDSGTTGKGMPYGSMAVVTSRNLISSNRCFIHSVSKPSRLAGLESVQLFLSDHSGLVSSAIKARAASRFTGAPCASSLMMCALDPPNTTARRAGPSGMSP